MDWKWECMDCADGTSYRFSHLVGTIFENTNVDLRQWFRVIHMMLTSKKGVSARQIHRVMGFGSYKTAWYMCHRIRVSLQDKEFKKLMGIVEVDETFVGGKAKNRHKDDRFDGTKGTGGSGKAIVVGAISRKGNLVARVIANVQADTLTRFIRESVSTEVSLVCTDKWKLAISISVRSSRMASLTMGSGEYVVGAIHTQTIEGFWSHPQTRPLSAPIIRSGAKYLPLYVAEFQFRLQQPHERRHLRGGHSRMLKRADWRALQEAAALKNRFNWNCRSRRHVHRARCKCTGDDTVHSGGIRGRGIGPWAPSGFRTVW